jgi:hypothetical protein
MCIGEVRQEVLKGSTITKACDVVAEKYGFNPSSMRSSFYAHQSESGVKRHGSSLLYEEQEEALSAMYIAFDICGHPLSVKQLRPTVKKVMGKDLHADWFSHFFERHEGDLVRRRKECAEMIRDKESFRTEVHYWTEHVGRFLAEKDLPAHAIFNPDETRVFEKNGNCYLQRVGARGRSQSVVESGGEVSLGSYIPFENAVGEMLMSVWVLKARYNAAREEIIGPVYTMGHELRESRSRYRWPRYFIYTIMDLFVKEFRARYPGLHCILFMDYLRLHAQAELVLNLALQNVYCIFFVKKSTRWLQPVDQRRFAGMKRDLIIFVEDAKFAAGIRGESFHGLLAAAAFDAEAKNFGDGSLKTGFSEVGIVPWNSAKIFERLEDELGSAPDLNPSLTLAVEAVKTVLDDTPSPRRAKKQVAKAQYDVPYLASDFIKQEEERLQNEEKKKKAKAKRAREKERRRMERAEAEERKKAERAERKKRKKEADLKAAEQKRKKMLETEKRRKAKDTGRRRKREEQDNNRCKLCPGLGRVWRGGAGWLECDEWAQCGYTQCPQCTRAHPTAMAKHENTCLSKGK